MNCTDCELHLAEGERDGAVEVHLNQLEEHLSQCAQCRMLAADLAANAMVFEALRSVELPRIAVKRPQRRRVYPWAAAVAVAAAAVIGILLPRPPVPAPPAVVPVQQAPPPAPANIRTERLQPLKIKMLTSDPNVVIYWLIDN
jgi:hypothetical protein